MERERRRSSEKIISVFQANELFVKKILSRNSSVGQQSSRYHCRMPGEVPFKWELRPGKPKVPPAKEYIPVIGPPPAILSQTLSRPHVPSPAKTTTTRFLFWKRSKKSHHMNKQSNHSNEVIKKTGSFRIKAEINVDANDVFLANKPNPPADDVDDQELLSSSCDSTTTSSSTSCSSSTSSTASSSSSSYALTVHHSKFHTLAKGLLRWPF